MGYHLNKLKMAMGGAVKGYAYGGTPDMEDLAANYDLDGVQLAATDYVKNPFQPQAATVNPVPTALPAQPEPVALPNITVTAAPEERLDVQDLLKKYYGEPSNTYGDELAAARKAAKAETDRFSEMIGNMMKEGSEKPSKAELYFNLMSAFGEPTKTGHFGENLGRAGKVVGEYEKDVRTAKNADVALRKQLALEAQKIKMQGAKEELGTLRSLAGEEMKDKRSIASELIKEYVKSGKPESTAGKQAKDEGLIPGTAEYQKRVKEIADTNIEKQLAGINSTLAGMSVQQANLALAQQKFGFQKEQAGKLTAGEVKMKTEAEDNLASMDQALKDLSQAYKLNPNTFDSSFTDVAQQKLLESFGSKDPKVLATRTQANLLGKQGIAKLRASFGGNPTEGERKILLDLEGIGAKSKEERAVIMRNAYSALKARRERENKRLNEINQGLYRETTPAPGGLE